MHYEDGSSYSGQWQNDVKNGQGKQVYKDGSYYDGEWKNNLQHGSGTQAYFDKHGNLNATYTGKFASNKRNGRGTMRYENGYEQTGEWRNDGFVG
jgi:hypothetical protein